MEFLSVEQLARRLACHGDTVRRLIPSGRLPAVKVVGRWRIDPADVSAVLDRSHSGASSVPDGSDEKAIPVAAKGR
jgi:excisionase family DNA binding protein